MERDASAKLSGARNAVARTIDSLVYQWARQTHGVTIAMDGIKGPEANAALRAIWSAAEQQRIAGEVAAAAAAPPAAALPLSPPNPFDAFRRTEPTGGGGGHSDGRRVMLRAPAAKHAKPPKEKGSSAASTTPRKAPSLYSIMTKVDRLAARCELHTDPVCAEMAAWVRANGAQVGWTFALATYWAATDSERGLSLRGLFDTVIVDEAQDLTPARMELFARQVPFVGTLCIGDPNQAIFDWAGAQSIFADPARLGVPARIMQLTHTFRFGRHVADLLNTVLGAQDASKPRVVAGFAPDVPVQVCDDVEDWVVRLCRTNATVWTVAAALQRRGVRVQVPKAALGAMVAAIGFVQSGGVHIALATDQDLAAAVQEDHSRMVQLVREWGPHTAEAVRMAVTEYVKGTAVSAHHRAVVTVHAFKGDECVDRVHIDDDMCNDRTSFEVHVVALSRSPVLSMSPKLFRFYSNGAREAPPSAALPAAAAGLAKKRAAPAAPGRKTTTVVRCSDSDNEDGGGGGGGGGGAASDSDSDYTETRCISGGAGGGRSKQQQRRRVVRSDDSDTGDASDATVDIEEDTAAADHGSRVVSGKGLPAASDPSWLVGTDTDGCRRITRLRAAKATSCPSSGRGKKRARAAGTVAVRRET